MRRHAPAHAWAPDVRRGAIGFPAMRCVSFAVSAPPQRGALAVPAEHDVDQGLRPSPAPPGSRPMVARAGRANGRSPPRCRRDGAEQQDFPWLRPTRPTRAIGNLDRGLLDQ